MLMLDENYLRSGYDVILNYIISNKEFEKIRTYLSKYEMHFVVLMAQKETIIERDEIRPEDQQMHRVVVHLQKFRDYGFEEKYILDTTDKV